ncbi:MAG: hypothetical protein Q4C87_12435, partial [Actinomycetaceae bacterium]|nr:hypothetical protein [Actinomycetaceae bacterium]
MSDETMNVAAHTAATSLLFQAPTFQAPEFRSTPAGGDDDTASVRKRRTRSAGRTARTEERSEEAE